MCCWGRSDTQMKAPKTAQEGMTLHGETWQRRRRGKKAWSLLSRWFPKDHLTAVKSTPTWIRKKNATPGQCKCKSKLNSHNQLGKNAQEAKSKTSQKKVSKRSDHRICYACANNAFIQKLKAKRHPGRKRLWTLRENVQMFVPRMHHEKSTYVLFFIRQSNKI